MHAVHTRHLLPRQHQHGLHPLQGRPLLRSGSDGLPALPSWVHQQPADGGNWLHQVWRGLHAKPGPERLPVSVQQHVCAACVDSGSARCLPQGHLPTGEHFVGEPAPVESGQLAGATAAPSSHLHMLQARPVPSQPAAAAASQPETPLAFAAFAAFAAAFASSSTLHSIQWLHTLAARQCLQQDQLVRPLMIVRRFRVPDLPAAEVLSAHLLTSGLVAAPLGCSCGLRCVTQPAAIELNGFLSFCQR